MPHSGKAGRRAWTFAGQGRQLGGDRGRPGATGYAGPLRRGPDSAVECVAARDKASGGRHRSRHDQCAAFGMAFQEGEARAAGPLSNRRKSGCSAAVRRIAAGSTFMTVSMPPLRILAFTWSGFEPHPRTGDRPARTPPIPPRSSAGSRLARRRRSIPFPASSIPVSGSRTGSGRSEKSESSARAACFCRSGRLSADRVVDRFGRDAGASEVLETGLAVEAPLARLLPVVATAGKDDMPRRGDDEAVEGEYEKIGRRKPRLEPWAMPRDENGAGERGFGKQERLFEDPLRRSAARSRSCFLSRRGFPAVGRGGRPPETR